MRVDAIVFDLGNTLVPFRREEGIALLVALQSIVEATWGPQRDFVRRAAEVRDRMIHERERGSMREVSMAEYLSELGGREVEPGLVAAAERTMHQSLLRSARLPEGRVPLLRSLAERYRLAVLSNFVLSEPIHEVLAREGLTEVFVTVEVSAAHGWMKPHGALFEHVRNRLGTAAERTLMVGDGFWPDVVGGHRAGFRTALTTEFHETEQPATDPAAPGVRPDLVLERLDQLPERLR